MTLSLTESFLYLATYSQQCFSSFRKDTVDRLAHIEERLGNPVVAPVLGLLINGLHDIVSESEASTALEKALDETLKITENEKLMKTFDYLIQSLTIVVQDENVREVLLKRLTLTNEVFHKDTAKAFISKGIQTSYRWMTDREVLRAVRQILRSCTRILTDPEAQKLIAIFLANLARIINNPETLADIQRSVKALDIILSSEQARKRIELAVQTMGVLNNLGQNNARRIGKMQSRLASPSFNYFPH